MSERDDAEGKVIAQTIGLVGQRPGRPTSQVAGEVEFIEVEDSGLLLHNYQPVPLLVPKNGSKKLGEKLRTTFPWWSGTRPRIARMLQYIDQVSCPGRSAQASCPVGQGKAVLFSRLSCGK